MARVGWNPIRLEFQAACLASSSWLQTEECGVTFSPPALRIMYFTVVTIHVTVQLYVFCECPAVLCYVLVSEGMMWNFPHLADPAKDRTTTTITPIFIRKISSRSSEDFPRSYDPRSGLFVSLRLVILAQIYLRRSDYHTCTGHSGSDVGGC